jgi:SAM-dependent methyltransferase
LHLREDDFVTLSARLRDAEDERQKQQLAAAQLRQSLHTSERKTRKTANELMSVYGSASWRATRPLRRLYATLFSTQLSWSDAEPPPSEAVRSFDWGDLRRTTPVSNIWGLDRGLPVDRYFIRHFLEKHREDIRGRVLEVKDSAYTTMLGHNVLQADVLDIDSSNPNATIVADLSRADHVPGDQFDCFVLTQTLHIIYDARSALGEAARLLKPGGVLLCTIPAVSRVNYENGGLQSGDYWRLTRAAVLGLFAEFFEPRELSVETFGNVQTCAAFLYGLAAEELEAAELDYHDPWFPLVHGIRAVRSSR